MAAIEAAEIYEYSSAVKGTWDFECWVISRVWQCYLSRKQHKQEENSMATKLTDKDRREIRAKYRAGDNIDEIARGYDISGQTVRNICSDLAYERKQAIAAFNNVQPEVKSDEEMTQENQPEPAKTASAEVGQNEPVKDSATAENVCENDEAEHASEVKDVNLYDLVRGFESFCRENVPGDFNLVINKNGDVISVTVANEAERLTYERGVNE